MILSIVIPAYNEADRINRTLATVAQYLGESGLDAEVIVVNDGSVDDTSTILRRYAARHPSTRVLDNERNLGKGASVRRGVLAARGEYILFMDADLSVPVDEIGPCLGLLAERGYPIVIGSRKVPGARIIRRQPLAREYMGHVFTWLARIMLHPEIVDFTCGFKAFRRDVAVALFSVQRRRDWAFDAEILHLAWLLNMPVHQHPVRWAHEKGSRVRFPRDVWRTLVGLVDIRWRGRSMLRQHRATFGKLLGTTAGLGGGRIGTSPL